MKSIDRVPVVQQVAESIKEFITSGSVEVGNKLPSEKELCETLSVGRSTIREALRILQTSGLVEIKPGRGAFVANNNLNFSNLTTWFIENEIELRDCIEIRLAIEPLAIKLAISRCTDEDIQEILVIHNKFLKAIEEKNPTMIAKYDARFHNKIVEKSNNKLLISINKQISKYVYNFRNKSFMMRQNALNAVEPHSNIMHSIISRDVEVGELYVKKHIQKILEDLVIVINK